VSQASFLLQRQNGIVSLFLTYFRNYKRLRLTLDTRSVLLTGPNGAGKTNVLEAISLLSSGKGLRQAPLSEIRTITAPALSNWSVSVQVQTPSGVLDLGTGLEEPSSRHAIERRIARIHHQCAKSLSAFDDFLWILWLTPSMDRLFTEAPQKRRQFFDHLVTGLFPKHKGFCAQYKILLKERMKLLMTRNSDITWISAIEKRLAHIGAKITAARNDFLKLLMGALPDTPSPFPFPEIHLLETYTPEGSIEETLCAVLEESRDQDAQTGNTAFGPHRTEWNVLFVEKGLPASACSTGEQKALLISIVLATARLYKERRQGVPLLLFDDLSAHIDALKQSALWQVLKNLEMQTWFTGVMPPHFPTTDADLQCFAVEHGICIPSSFHPS
jgi:DNA replication and repair protein RecF